MAGDGRWDWLEGVRPESALDALAREAGRAIADELAAWPPRLAWTDARSAARFQPVLAPGAPPPSVAARTLGFRLARWDLGRQQDALDHALRTGVLAQVGTPDDALAAELVWRWLTEWLLELAERVAARLTRAHLVAALDHAEGRLRGLATTA
ncbi:MAG: hypothetical protein R2939_22170 [Kofleriaceae bacterium]